VTAYHWHEYPVGRLGGLATALARTLAAFAVGLGVTTGAILVVGMLKDNVIHDLASHWGADTDALSAGIDDLLRMSIGPLVGIGYLVALAACVAVLVRDTAISRAVVQAARDGATKEAVPTPYQIRSIIADSFALQWFALWSAIIGAVVFLPFGIYAVVDAYAPGILIAVCALIWAAIMVAVFLVVRRRTVPAHDRRRQSIASHWIYEDEHAVWQRAAGPSESDADRDWRARVGRGLTGMGATIGLAAALVLLLVLFVTHPHARTLPGSAHAGPEVTYTGLMGHGVDTARWVVAALCVAALLVTLVGMLLEGAGAAAERAMLARAARDRSAKTPPGSVLSRHTRWHPARPAQLAAGLAGLGLTVGIAALLLATTHTRVFRGSADVFADFEEPAVLLIVCALVVFVAALAWNAVTRCREPELRNLLLSRWPTAPDIPTGSDVKAPPALTGPALTRRRRTRR